jgi:hypothetical protein
MSRLQVLAMAPKKLCDTLSRLTQNAGHDPA